MSVRGKKTTLQDLLRASQCSGTSDQALITDEVTEGSGCLAGAARDKPAANPRWLREVSEYSRNVQRSKRANQGRRYNEDPNDE